MTAQVTGRSTNLMDFSRLLERMKQSMVAQQESREKFVKAPELKVNIVYDPNQQHIGVLLRLNSLMKRLEVVKYLIGDWKPSSTKYASVTD